MNYEIKVPAVSEGVDEGTVSAIAVAVGDRVVEGDTLFELETEKAVVDIPSTHAGGVAEIRIAVGDTVTTGALAMLIEGEAAGQEQEAPADKTGESDEREAKERAVGRTSPHDEPETDDTPERDEAKDEQERSTSVRPEDEPDLTTVRPGHEVAPAAPSIRREAREFGVDIYRVRGSGPGGRIGREDLRRYIRQTMQGLAEGTAAVSKPDALPDFTRWGEIETEALSRIGRVTADAMHTAWTTIPMVTQFGQGRISSFETFRKDFNRQADTQIKLTVTALLVKICAAALRHFPRFNSSLDLANHRLIYKKYVHIGVAVDTDAGLLVPVVRDADKKDIETLALELDELAQRARERKLKPDEMEGGCFTISNLGGVGRDTFTPIVYPPQVAILGVARSRHEPVWDGQDFAPELVLPLSLTYDHRVINGADGARFMQWICKAIEYPLQLVMRG